MRYRRSWSVPLTTSWTCAGTIRQGELRGGGGLFRGKATEVILKRAKPRVGGAEEMLQLEVEMNCRVSERCAHGGAWQRCCEA
jgi:hypothetical protein